MIEFLRGKADVLVSTTIIESGLDIPQANTLIVERADKLGLAQLYQIRGRVGPLARARLRLPAVSVRGGAERRGGRAACDALRLHRARLGLQDRDARPRDPRRRQPARRGAVGSRRRGRLRALLPDARRGGRASSRTRDGDERATRRSGAGAPGRAGRRLHPGRLRPLRGREDRHPPPHRRQRASPTELDAPRARSSRTASAPPPEPVENLIKLQEARIKLGRAGARTRRVPGGRLVVAPIALDLEQVQGAARARCPRRSTNRSRRRSGCRFPTSPRSASPRSCDAAERPDRRVRSGVAIAVPARAAVSSAPARSSPPL